VTLTVNKSTLANIWEAPVAITYGAALNGAQLNASSIVAGTFAYSPAAETVLDAGQQTLTARFTPTDTADESSGSTSVTPTVNKATPGIALASSTDPAYLSTPVTFTATLSAAASSPTGIVSFYDVMTLLGPGTMSAGMATCTTATLAAGRHSITAAYSGDSNFTTLTTGAVTETIENFTIGVSSGSAWRGARIEQWERLRPH
jgi:hypothetical protein